MCPVLHSPFLSDEDWFENRPSLFLAPSIRNLGSGLMVRNNPTTDFKNGTLGFCQSERR